MVKYICLKYNTYSEIYFFTLIEILSCQFVGELLTDPVVLCP